MIGSGTIAGIGFTVSLLIAALAFDGDQLAEAKLGVLVAARDRLGLLTWVVFQVTAAAAARHRRAEALLRPGRAT